MLYTYDEIKIKQIKEVERLRNEMPESILKIQCFFQKLINLFDLN